LKENKNALDRYDPELIDKIKEGDVGSFEVIFRTYYKKLYEFSFFFVLNEQVAEDIVQDVFFYIWEHRENMNPDLNLKSYLFSAAKNRSLNYKRHQRVAKSSHQELVYILDSVDMPDELLQCKDFEEAIGKAIESLPEKRRVIFYLHRFEKLTYKEIADTLEISVRTVQTQIKRSLKHLEEQLLHFLHIMF
jgi:RNA polymerase sigma-70 factor (ECF subfamily)